MSRRNQGGGLITSLSRATVIALLALSIPAAIAQPGSAQRQPVMDATTIMSVPVSPSVIATAATRGGDLVVLVLWRGAPHWYRSNPGRSAQGGGGSQDGRVTATLEYGGHRADVEFNPAALTATVQGRTTSLPPGTNVLLVDNVDTPGGGGLVKTLSIDPADVDPHPRQGMSAWTPLLARSQDVVAFLQCEAEPTDPQSAMPCQDPRLRADREGRQPRTNPEE